MVPFSYLTGHGGDQNGRVIEIVEGRLRQLLKPILLEVAMDEEWYLKVNVDVNRAVDTGLFASARDHYVTAGYFEDRMPRPILVDEAWYSRRYPDVAAALQEGKFHSGQEHFATSGFREGRLPSPGWSLQFGRNEQAEEVPI